MVQIPVRCIVCGEATGNLVDPAIYSALTNEAQHCSNCLAAAAVEQGDLECPNCGANSLNVQHISNAAAEFRRDDDGAVYVQLMQVPEASDDEVSCSSCGHEFYSAEHYSSIEPY